MKKDYTGLIWGIIFLIAGIVFAGNALNFWYIDLFFPGWWTLFLIIPGIVSILRHGLNWGSGILVIIGLMLLFDSLDIFDSRVMWSLVGPLVLLAIGFSIIASFFRSNNKKCYENIEYDESDNDKSYEDDKKGYYKYDKNKSYQYDSSAYPQYRAILGGGDYKNSSSSLKGISAEAILGGLEIDLRDAQITQDIVLDLTSVLGSIEIYLPNNVRVEIMQGTPILGGFEHKVNVNATSGPKVRIKYVAVLGGIEIK